MIAKTTARVTVAMGRPSVTLLGLLLLLSSSLAWMTPPEDVSLTKALLPQDAAVSHVPLVIAAGQLSGDEIPTFEKDEGYLGAIRVHLPQAVDAGQVPPAQVPPDEMPAFRKENGGERSGECLTYYGCNNFTANHPTGTFSTQSTSWTLVDGCVVGGEYAYYAVAAGQTYEWSLCPDDGGNPAFDSQLTLWDGYGMNLYCYSDDYCGYQSKIMWTAPFDAVMIVLVSQYNCADNATCTTLVWRCASCAPPPPPDTATISDAYWVNVYDGDGDGCPGRAWLYWDPDVADCNGTLDVLESIYIRAPGGSWTLVDVVGPHTITDCATSDGRYWIGWYSGSDTPCTPFDVMIEIYRVGQSSPDYVRSDSNDADLNDFYIEEEGVTIYDAWWSNLVDQDGDGCMYQARLNWDPDVLYCSGSWTVYEEIYSRVPGGNWELLWTTSNHTIANCATSDAQYVTFTGVDPCTVRDWRIQIYRVGYPWPDYTRDDSNDYDLDDFDMEGPDLPDTATIADAWWSNPID